MDAALKNRALAAGGSMVRALAYHTDRLCGRRALETVYKKELFKSPVKSQPASRLLGLPTELRLMIYEHLFAPPYACINLLAILATCRLLHGEALVLALEKAQFHMSGHKGLSYQSKLWALGLLQEHLRHVNITMPIQKLSDTSANSPFILTELPLDILKIDFRTIDTKDWLVENRAYQSLISAMLYKTEPAKINSSTKPVYKSLVAKNRRRVDSAFLTAWATKRQLWNFLLGMQTKKVELRAKDDGKDVIWSSFTHFDLVDHIFTVIRTGGDDGHRHHMMFGDDDGHCFLQMGRGLTCREYR
jgi:hypothetical protein